MRGLAAVLGGLGLILSAIGVYGVIAYSVSQRTQEIGIRMALGALPASILELVLRQGVVIVAAGLGLGIACALSSAKLVGKFLVVSGSDPLTYCTVSLALHASGTASVLSAATTQHPGESPRCFTPRVRVSSLNGLHWSAGRP